MATTDELLVKANELIKEKNYQGVIDLLPEEVLEECKSDGLYAEKARAYNSLKDYELCFEAAEKALAINPNNVIAHNSIGNVYAHKGQQEKAIEEYEKVIELDPRLSYPYFNLGLSYYELEQYDKAINAFKEAIKINPKDCDSYNSLADTYYLLKQYTNAIEAYQEANKINPKDSYTYGKLGNSYYNIQKYDKSIDAYNEAIKTNPKDPIAIGNLGNAYRELKQYDKAIEKLNEVIKIDPKESIAYYNLGRTYYELKQYEKAIEALNRAIKINPKDSSLYNGLGNVYDSLKHYDKAIEAYNEAIKINPKSSYPYNGIGNEYRVLKQYEQAIDAYSKAINIDPKYSTAYYNRALTYFDQGQYDEALIDYKKKIELTKDNPDYYTSLAIEKLAEIGKLIDDKTYGDIDALVNKIKRVLLYEEKCIAHYTTMTVAKTLILDKSKLRLSEAAYLNDTSEGKELFDFLDLSAPAPVGQTTVTENFIKKPFIGSFVAENKCDDLTLWRMYGKEAKDEARGCSITMLRNELINNITENLPGYKKEDTSKADSEFIFYRVAYRKQRAKNPFTVPSGKPKDEKKLNGYMNDLKVKVKDFEEKRSDNVADKQKLLELLNEIAFLFKSYDYQYEHEIRLVLKGTGLPKIVNTDYTPPKVYIELVTIMPVITTITLGPKVERAEEWVSAFYYGLSNNVCSANILISHLPFK